MEKSHGTTSDERKLSKSDCCALGSKYDYLMCIAVIYEYQLNTSLYVMCRWMSSRIKFIEPLKTAEQ